MKSDLKDQSNYWWECRPQRIRTVNFSFWTCFIHFELFAMSDSVVGKEEGKSDHIIYLFPYIYYLLLWFSIQATIDNYWRLLNFTIELVLIPAFVTCPVLNWKLSAALELKLNSDVHVLLIRDHYAVILLLVGADQTVWNLPKGCPGPRDERQSIKSNAFGNTRLVCELWFDFFLCF